MEGSGEGRDAEHLLGLHGGQKSPCLFTLEIILCAWLGASLSLRLRAERRLAKATLLEVMEPAESHPTCSLYQ